MVLKIIGMCIKNPWRRACFCFLIYGINGLNLFHGLKSRIRIKLISIRKLTLRTIRLTCLVSSKGNGSLRRWNDLSKVTQIVMSTRTRAEGFLLQIQGLSTHIYATVLYIYHMGDSFRYKKLCRWIWLRSTYWFENWFIEIVTGSMVF